MEFALPVPAPHLGSPAAYHLGLSQVCYEHVIGKSGLGAFVPLGFKQVRSKLQDISAKLGKRPIFRNQKQHIDSAALNMIQDVGAERGLWERYWLTVNSSYPG